MTKLEEIRERWSNVTPGEWKYDSCSGRVYTSPPFDLHRFDQMDTDIFKVEELEGDGIAAAHAPADIAALAAAVEGVLAVVASPQDHGNIVFMAEAVERAITEALS